MDKTLIQRIKDTFTIADAWQALALPGTPARSCRIPWAEKDRRPSFSVFQENRRWFNHRDGTGGDVLDFVREATGMETAEAVRWLASKTGLSTSDPTTPDARPRMRPAPPRRAESQRKPEAWPTLRPSTPDERQALAEIRGFSMGGIALAESRGLLHFGVYDSPCPWRQHWKGAAFWAVTDAARRLVELRRLDGAQWPEKDGTAHRKAHTIGHGKDHPCGIIEASCFPILALVEGAPDLVAAHDLLSQMGTPESVGVAAVLGAGVARLATDCLPHFKDKHVRIYPHHDEHGLRAARQWAQQIAEADAAAVDAFDLSGITTRSGTTGKDLADLINIHPDCLRGNPELLNDLFP